MKNSRDTRAPLKLTTRGIIANEMIHREEGRGEGILTIFILSPGLMLRLFYEMVYIDTNF